MRDLYNHLDQVNLALPQVMTADLTPAAGVELDDAEGIILEAIVGTNGGTLDGSNYFDLIVEDSDDGSTFAAVTDANYLLGVAGVAGVVASGIIATVDGAADDDQTYRCGYVGPKRFVQIKADVTGAGVSIPIALAATKGVKHRNGL